MTFLKILAIIVLGLIAFVGLFILVVNMYNGIHHNFGLMIGITGAVTTAINILESLK